ncbi:MAG: hypothetical protein J6D30_01635 [Clostridia bacterium]|nr:hypothetical protein [Clostridia bacterium]
MFKKTMAVALSAITLFSMAGCGGPDFKRDSSSEYDPEKSYLNIGNFNGGLGYAWLEEVANNYMALKATAIEVSLVTCGAVPLLETFLS